MAERLDRPKSSISRTGSALRRASSTMRSTRRRPAGRPTRWKSCWTTPALTGEAGVVDGGVAGDEEVGVGAVGPAPVALDFPRCGQAQGEGVEVDDVVHASRPAQAQLEPSRRMTLSFGVDRFPRRGVVRHRGGRDRGDQQVPADERHHQMGFEGNILTIADFQAGQEGPGRAVRALRGAGHAPPQRPSVQDGSLRLLR